MPTSEFSLEELDDQQALLLPEREALSLFNWASIVANNQALAVNAVTLGSTAVATANQAVITGQF
jgi:hypothetical protein